MGKSVRKAVIPAAGLGTRFLPATKAQPKEMLPLVDKPAIQYVVEEAVRSGMTDILIVTGRGKRSMEDHFDRSFELEHYLERTGRFDALNEMRAIAELADIHYIRQGEPLGLGHAVSVARDHVGGQPFAVLLGDDLMSERVPLLDSMVGIFDAEGCSVLALKRTPLNEISAYGCVRAEEKGEDFVQVMDVVEKPSPQDAPSDLAIVGRYVFTPEIFDALAQVKPGKGGEIQLTDAIRDLLAVQSVYGKIFSEGRYDVGNKSDYLRATVEIALERPDLGPAFLEYLRERVAREPL